MEPSADNAPKERVFLASFGFLYKYSLALGSLAMILMYVIQHHADPLAGLIRYLLFMALPMLIAYGVTSLLLRWFYRVRVVHDGIRGGTFWSTPVYMRWSEMESVEPRVVLGLPYLRIKSFRESCPTLWLPRFLAEPAAFKEMVISQNAPMHPLRRSLENGNTPEKRERLAA